MYEDDEVDDDGRDDGTGAGDALYERQHERLSPAEADREYMADRRNVAREHGTFTSEQEQRENIAVDRARDRMADEHRARYPASHHEGDPFAWNKRRDGYPI